MQKLCLLVGGSRGLGAALLKKYLNENFQVIEFSRSGEGEGHVAVDLGSREAAIGAIDEVFAEQKTRSWDEVHLILNAAVVDPLGPLSGSEPEAWWRHMDINFTLPISILGCLQRHFQGVECRKVAGFVSSGLAVSAMDGSSLYCATKAGVEHFIRSMALEQARLPFPIECANLNPGIMDTGMQADIRESSAAELSQVNMFRDFKAHNALVDPGIVANNVFAVLTQPFENGGRIDVSG
ncbi:SDR family NAD(P)-dependent oxidoreductase [Pseudohalioglobus sediminis]|nr:SDR family NAD(P)-dependent oxidoreductase [Pseudohalioglobus sediminis]